MISEFPLFVFTTLGGLAAGAYVFFALFPRKENDRLPWLLPLICLVLLGASGLVLLGHLGHPERMLNALANPSAGIAQEAYTMIAFGIVALADTVLCFVKGSSPRWLRVVGAVCAALMIAAMGMAYFTVVGIEAWASWETILLFVFGDLAMGATLRAVLFFELARKTTFTATCIALDALTAASLAAMGVRFVALGYDVLPFAIGIVFVLVGAALSWFGLKREISRKAVSIAAFACVLVGVAVARYAFYAIVAL